MLALISIFQNHHQKALFWNKVAFNKMLTAVWRCMTVFHIIVHRMNSYSYFIKFLCLQNWRDSQGLNTFPVTGKRFRQLFAFPHCTSKTSRRSSRSWPKDTIGWNRTEDNIHFRLILNGLCRAANCYFTWKRLKRCVW